MLGVRILQHNVFWLANIPRACKTWRICMTDNPGKHRQTKLFRIKVTSTLTSQTSPWLIINSDVIMPLKLCLHAHELNSYAYFPQILSRLFLLLGFQVVMLVKHCVVMVANASSDMLRGTIAVHSISPTPLKTCGCCTVRRAIFGFGRSLYGNP